MVGKCERSRAMTTRLTGKTRMFAFPQGQKMRSYAESGCALRFDRFMAAVISSLL